MVGKKRDVDVVGGLRGRLEKNPKSVALVEVVVFSVEDNHSSYQFNRTTISAHHANSNTTTQ